MNVGHAGHRGHRGAGVCGLDPVGHRDDLVGRFEVGRGRVVADRHVRAQLVQRVVGQRSHHGDLRRAGTERKRVIGVVEQHLGLVGDRLRRRQMGRGQLLGRHPRVAALVRIGEHPGQVLERQHVTDCVVELGHRDLALAEQLRAVLVVGGIDRVAAARADSHRHLDVHTRTQRQPRGVRAVRRVAEVLQFLDRLVVAHGGPAETPLIAQDRLEQVGVGGIRDPVERVERAHHTRRAGVHRRLIRRQVVVEQLLGRHIDGVVFTAGDGSAIGAEVLDRRGQPVRGGEIRPLIALHLGGCDRRPQVRILAGALHDATPPWITADVDHRIERPLDPVGARLVGGHRLGGGHQRGIPARRLTQWHREHRPVSVDHVEAEDQGNVEP